MEEKKAQNNAPSVKDRDRETLIMALVKMRIEKFATSKTMLDFLMGPPFNYKDSYSYELIREAKKRIIEIFKEEHAEEYETYKGRLEEIIETTKSEKIRLEAIKELNKLTGAYKASKVDITSNGKDLIPTEVIIKIVDSNDKNISE
jgi:hypothetical protein